MSIIAHTNIGGTNSFLTNDEKNIMMLLFVYIYIFFEVFDKLYEFALVFI